MEDEVKNKNSFLFLVFLLLCSQSYAIPSTIRIQGRLTDNSGAPVVGPNNLIKIQFYSAPTAGTLIAQALGDDGSAGTAIAVTTNDAGLFATDISFAPTNAFDSNADVYLDVQVHASGDFRHLSPRQKLSTVPLAMHAETANVSNTTANVGTNSVGSAQIINASIESVDIDTGAVQGLNIASGTVETVNLANNSVTDSKVNSISAPKITGQITSVQIETVDTTQITGMAGIVVAFGGTVAPPGWLLCDGSAVSRGTYSVLFGAIGVNFGVGDGNTTFNLPDLRGRFIRGVTAGTTRDPDASTRTPMNSGGNSGNAVGSVQGDNVGPHTHSITDPGHTHSLKPDLSNGVVAVQNGHSNDHVSGGGNDGGSFAITDTLLHTTGISINQSTGSETRPINAYMNYIIKY
jgi:microcystin-dependent protein